MPPEFWRVYNYIARCWYESEVGVIENADRYQPAMFNLEHIAASTKGNTTPQ